jgi:DNA repair protein RecO (recombination protein O)
MTRWNTQAVVLRSDPQGESDLLVRMLTPGQGLVSAVAKGALRSKKRFAGIFDLAQVIEAGLMTAPRSGRVMVEHASVKAYFPGFRDHPMRLARASLLIEIALLGVAEAQPSTLIFNNLRQGLYRLHSEPDSDRWAAAYSYRMLAGLGYKPGLDCCVRCRKKASGRGIIFNTAAGGILCPDCCGHEEAAGSDLPSGDRLVISMDTARTLTEIMRSPEKRLSRISFTRNALSQAMDILPPFIAYHLHRRSRTLEFMRQMREYSDH